MKVTIKDVLKRAGFIPAHDLNKVACQLKEHMNLTRKRVKYFLATYKVDRKAEERIHFMCMDTVSYMNGYDNKSSNR